MCTYEFNTSPDVTILTMSRPTYHNALKCALNACPNTNIKINGIDSHKIGALRHVALDNQFFGVEHMHEIKPKYSR